MFKSKIDQNAFDLNNKKVKNIEFSKVKNLANNAVKKLLDKPGEQTPFHLISTYFKDNGGKPTDPFVNFGINKKMDKHFQQVEMKTGKMDQSMSGSPKEASMGVAYAKEENGTTVLCLEPDPKCKVPKGQWAKIIKALKPFLAGTKAVVVAEGQMIGEEELEGTDTTNTEEGTDQSDTITGETTSSTGEPTGDPSAKEKREKTLNTLNNGINKMDGAVGKVDKVKLQANIEKYELALVKLIEEANADGIVDDKEKAAITEAEEKLAALKQNVEENGGKLTAEKLEKMNENIGQIEQRLEKLFAGLGV